MPGGKGGVPFETVQCMRGVKEVRVWHGKYIDAIQFAIKDGKESPKYGGNGGRADVFQVDDDEEILCVDVYANKLVDGLSFGTKEGTFQSKEGLAAGVAVKFKKCAADGAYIIGFKGRYGTFLDALEVTLASEYFNRCG